MVRRGKSVGVMAAYVFSQSEFTSGELQGFHFQGYRIEFHCRSNGVDGFREDGMERGGEKKGRQRRARRLEVNTG